MVPALIAALALTEGGKERRPIVRSVRVLPPKLWPLNRLLVRIEPDGTFVGVLFGGVGRER